MSRRWKIFEANTMRETKVKGGQSEEQKVPLKEDE